MTFGLLVLGLVMLCVDDTEDCRLTGGVGQPAARFLVINATQFGPNCSSLGCNTCKENNAVSLHNPLLVFYDETGVLGESCDRFGAYDVPEEVRCRLLPAGRLCVSLTGSASLTLNDNYTAGGNLPTNESEALDFEWVTEPGHFVQGTLTLNSDDQLIPGVDKSVFATLDLPNYGHLTSIFLAQNRKLRKYIPFGRDSGTGRGLADGILWTVADLQDSSIVITDCAGDTYVELSADEADSYLALVNLPDTVFDNPGGGPTPDAIGHYRLYYNLFQEDLCGVPIRRGANSAHVWSYDIARWVAYGEANLLSAGRNLVATGGALCPPSKFP